MEYYISIENNIEKFELFKSFWGKRNIEGIRADSMTEGIEKAIAIEKLNINEIYFIDIVADEIDFMPQLKILSEETDAPILIATSDYCDKEHHEALNNGADFYGAYCETAEQNIRAVLSVINSINRRVKKQRPPSNIMVYKDLLIATASRQVFLKDTQVHLTKLEYDILLYLQPTTDIFFPNHKF